MIESLAHDVRIAARSLARSPGFLVTAVLSLGLAIGAGISGFSVLDAVRFRSLPFPDSDRLVVISEVPKGGCPAQCDVNYLTFRLLREHQFRSIDAMTALQIGLKSLGTGENQVDVLISLVSPSAFAMLGVQPERGRIFTADEDKLGAPGTMLIAHDLWVSFFGSDPDVVGKTFTLSDEPFTVIGVMPRGFSFEAGSQAWLAAHRYMDPRTGTSVRAATVIARLAPNATAHDLEGELGTLEAAANQSRPENLRTTFGVAPLRTRYVAGTRGQDLVFGGIVGAILLIACANVAGLVLVRSIRNKRELAIRTALGANRGSLTRHLLVQNGLLVGAGMLVGLFVASSVLPALRASAQLPGMRVPGMAYQLDWRAALFALLLSAVVAVLLSLAPLRLIVSTRLQETLREGALAATMSRGGNRTQELLVIVQTGCAVALLIGTGLMVRTALRFSGIDLGYDAGRVTFVTPIPAHAGRARSVYLPFSERLLVEIAAIPGVEKSAVRATNVALGTPRPGELLTVTLDDGSPLPRDLQPRNAIGVSPDYFAVVGVPIMQGRAFTVADNEAAPQVAIVNEWAAKRWWPKASPIGRTFSVDTAPGVRATVTVVGVVRDNLAAASSVLLAKPGPEVYRPFRQANFWVATYVARVSGQPGRIIDEMRRGVMRSVPNGRPGAGLASTAVEAQVARVRSSALEIGGFAAIGLLLAITGLYGVLSYLVQQRTQEIGIRGVLGAGRREILALVLRRAMGLAAAGIVVGLATAAYATRFIQGILFGTPVTDPAVYVAVALVFTLVALAAGYLPARRAAALDPAIALRN